RPRDFWMSTWTKASLIRLPEEQSLKRKFRMTSGLSWRMLNSRPWKEFASSVYN
ncbi:hypothetical protein GGF39_002845, partial [Coemansia sp. RSA 1721]